MGDPLKYRIDGNTIIPGNGVRLQRIGALHLLEMPIPPSRVQVYTPRQQRDMDLCAEQSPKT